MPVETIVLPELCTAFEDDECKRMEDDGKLPALQEFNTVMLQVLPSEDLSKEELKATKDQVGQN
jgi:hypothetical protein